MEIEQKDFYIDFENVDKNIDPGEWWCIFRGKVTQNINQLKECGIITNDEQLKYFLDFYTLKLEKEFEKKMMTYTKEI